MISTVSQSIYLYKAILDRVIDGDTIVCAIDLGFKIVWDQHMRFVNVDAFETRGSTAEPRGKVATEFLTSLFSKYGPEFYFRSQRDAVVIYNRVAGWPFLEIAPGQWIDVCATIKASGFDKTIGGEIKQNLVTISADDISLVYPR